MYWVDANEYSRSCDTEHARATISPAFSNPNSMFTTER
jgi:hypothetical protein